jgi:hypothetical protein
MAAAPGSTVMPFDYAATFELTGRPGNTVQSVINIAPDSLFVAVGISYGLEERPERAVTLIAPAVGPPPPPPPPPIPATAPANLTLAQFPALALIDGFRISPLLESLALGANLQLNSEALPGELLQRLFERIAAPGAVSFLLSMVDTSSGRELQDEPVHNLASIGSADGERPFRRLARPIPFPPRSTIRLQVTEQSPLNDSARATIGTLFVVLWGYKIETTACPEPVVRALGAGRRVGPAPGGRSIPFDYVTRFRLTGRPGNEVVDEIAIEAGGYLATSIGYGLMVEESGVTLRDPSGDPLPDPVDLQMLALRFFPPDALLDGIRIRQDLVRFAFQNDGALSTETPLDVAQRLFVRLNQPDSVSFRYRMFDSGTGRELQNLPIFNIAGLGAADGDRPFRALARPLRFQPGSTLRINITERLGRGTLFIVFQGYRSAAVSA